MTGVHVEERFEAAIEASMLAAGWHNGSPHDYRADLGLDVEQLFAFIHATHAKAWAKVLGYYSGDEATGREAFAKHVAEAIDQQGPLDILRHGLKDHGVLMRLAFFAPASTLSAELVDLHAANRLSVTRQLRYSATTTDELDLTLFVNGIPTATAELKNPLTGQDVEHAKRQYREDRSPRELLFARRTSSQSELATSRARPSRAPRRCATRPASWAPWSGRGATGAVPGDCAPSPTERWPGLR